MRFIILTFLSLLSTISYSEESTCNYKGMVKINNSSIELLRLEPTDKTHDYQGGTAAQTTIISGLYQFVRVKNAGGTKSSWYVFRCANSQNKYDNTKCTRSKIVPFQSADNNDFFKTANPDISTNATPYAKINKDSVITFELRSSYDEPTPYYISASESTVEVKHNKTTAAICEKSINLNGQHQKSKSSNGNSKNVGKGQ